MIANVQFVVGRHTNIFITSAWYWNGQFISNLLAPKETDLQRNCQQQEDEAKFPKIFHPPFPYPSCFFASLRRKEDWQLNYLSKEGQWTNGGHLTMKFCSNLFTIALRRVFFNASAKKGNSLR